MPASELTVSRPEEGVLLVRLAGSWVLGADLPSLDGVRQEIETTRPARLRFDTSALERWDTGLLTALRSISQDCSAHQVEADRDGLPEGARRLLALSEAVPEKTGTGRGGAAEPFLVRVGKRFLDAVDHAQEFLTFLGKATLALGRLIVGRATFPRGEFATVVRRSALMRCPSSR